MVLFLLYVVGLSTIFVVKPIPENEIITNIREFEGVFVETVNSIIDDEETLINKDNYDHDDENLNIIFKDLGYESIHRHDENYIYFVRKTELEFGQGIIYSVHDKPPENHYFYDIHKFDNNWFYFTMH